MYLTKAYDNENNIETLFEGVEGISFVHKEYIEDIITKYRRTKRKGKKGKAEIKTRREQEIRVWRDFFVKLGVNNGLKLIKTNETYLSWEEKSKLRNRSLFTKEVVTDYNLEMLKAILEEIVNNKSENKSKLLLLMLEKQWTELSKYVQLKYEWKYHKWYTAVAESTWIRLLKTSFWLPTSKKNLANPSEVFLDKKEIKEFLGDTVPYLTINLRNEEFIKAVGINTEANVEGVINNLKSLKEQKCQDVSLFIKLYEFLNRKYIGNESTIKSAFSEHKIIYIPDTNQNYFSCKEVIWKDVSEVFGKNRGYLEGHYPKLKSFFVFNLDVSEKPTSKDYANVLIDLSQKENLDEDDEKIILKIYDELNSYLKAETNWHGIYEARWWRDFISKPIFWTDINKFLKNDGNVFVNDNPEIYKLFKSNQQIAFLKLPENYHPKIQHFIRAAGLRYLTKAVKIRLATTNGAERDRDLTAQIRRLAPYVLRYFYQLEYDIYEKLKEDGTFAQLKNLRVYIIDSLKVEYILDNYQPAVTQRNAILYDGNLYIQKDNLRDIDRLAAEFSKLFGEKRGLDDFLILLFNKKSVDEIENLLRVKGIQELPQDEKEWFEGVNVETEDIGRNEVVEPIVGNTPPNFPITNAHPSSVHSQSTNEEPIEKKGWQPESSPTETEIHVEALQVLEKTDHKIQDIEETHGKPKTFPEPPREIERDTLTQEDRAAIGKWGEEYALNYLRDILSKKYHEGKVEETDNGFTIICDGKKVVEVHWLNKIEDKGHGYDIKVIENGNEEFIEVKSTKTNDKEWFDLSNKQWQFLQEKGDKFHIYRIYNAGTDEAKLVDILNPKKLWQDGSLIAYPIRIQI
jgi:lipopolysaccharide export LptBFGC system permease protein LptF